MALFPVLLTLPSLPHLSLLCSPASFAVLILLFFFPGAVMTHITIDLVLHARGSFLHSRLICFLVCLHSGDMDGLLSLFLLY